MTTWNEVDGRLVSDTRVALGWSLAAMLFGILLAALPLVGGVGVLLIYRWDPEATITATGLAIAAACGLLGLVLVALLLRAAARAIGERRRNTSLSVRLDPAGEEVSMRRGDAEPHVRIGLGDVDSLLISVNRYLSPRRLDSASEALWRYRYDVALVLRDGACVVIDVGVYGRQLADRVEQLSGCLGLRVDDDTGQGLARPATRSYSRHIEGPTPTPTRQVLEESRPYGTVITVRRRAGGGPYVVAVLLAVVVTVVGPALSVVDDLALVVAGGGILLVVVAFFLLQLLLAFGRCAILLGDGTLGVRVAFPGPFDTLLGRTIEVPRRQLVHARVHITGDGAQLALGVTPDFDPGVFSSLLFRSGPFRSRPFGVAAGDTGSVSLMTGELDDLRYIEHRLETHFGLET